MYATRILHHRGGDLLTTVREKLRTKDWVFTMNNPEPQQMESLHSPESKVRYLVYQLEVAETGTEHLQGYVEFVEGMTWPEVKEILGDATFFKRRRGSRESARSYCMKEESRIRGPWEIGTWEDLREGDSEGQCEYILSDREIRRCRNLTYDQKYCSTHQKIVDDS